jgi:glycosyltransferase involved in cell wall biosynthesis
MTVRTHPDPPAPSPARRPGRGAPSILMLAYTNYETDPRVIRAAEAAVEGGFAVDVLVLRRPGQPAVEMVRGVRVIRLAQARYRGPSRLRYVAAYFEFFVRCAVASTRLFHRRRYSAIHVHNMPDVLVFSALVPRIRGAKVILDIHDPMPETFRSKFGTSRTVASRLLLLAERLSVAFASATITVSEPVKTRILVEEHGYRHEQIGVVANFADDRLFRPIPYPPTDGALRFVFHGTILERYGLRTLIEAVAATRNRERLRVRIIGEGDFSATLTQLIARRQLHNVVQFVNRLYPLYEIPRLLSDCHVGLVSFDLSHIGNFALPLKLVEYTCLGLPSITVRNAAIEHYFRPDECLFFESGDVGGLAALLDRVTEHPECLIHYRSRIAQTRARLSWSGEKAKYVAMLRNLASADGLHTPLP